MPQLSGQSVELGAREPEDVEALVGSEELLDAGEALVHGSPAGREQLDQHRKVIDAGVSLGSQHRLDAFELTAGADAQPTDFGEVAPDRRGFGADAVPDGRCDLLLEWPVGHERDDSFRIGWTLPSSTTTFRPG